MSVKGIRSYNGVGDGSVFAIDFSFISGFSFGPGSDYSRLPSVSNSEYFNYFRRGAFKLIEGRHITSEDDHVVLISTALAERNGLNLGDTITVQCCYDAGGYPNVSLKIVGINTVLEKGKIYAILGPSGCGKTTLLSLLGGLDSPTNGAILFDGLDIEKTGLASHRKNNVAFIFQSYNLIDYLTPLENVALTAKFDPKPILERMGLTAEESKRNVMKLSGGQQQRVAIARALASDASVILGDEPTGNLDEDTAAEIIEILKECAHKMGKCVVVVTHSKDFAKQVDVVLRLKKGELHVEEK